jgi:hypothetical protein
MVIKSAATKFVAALFGASHQFAPKSIYTR